MGLCLSTFPPSDGLENFLELFLRLKGEANCVRKLHKIVFGGARGEGLTVDDIERGQHVARRGSIFFGGPPGESKGRH
jgi:hypothetical protein